jgi:uncharacterized protein (DUF488 family)
MEIYTIGHSTHEMPQFLDLLAHFGIDVVIDVRSSPYSRHVPHFNRETLYGALEASGIAYCFMGAVLGGRPRDLSCYTAGEVDYDLIRGKEWFQAAVDQLIELISEPGNYALMCSEADPLACHRHNLLARELVDRDITVWHIISDAGAPGVKQAEFISQGTLF